MLRLKCHRPRTGFCCSCETYIVMQRIGKGGEEALKQDQCWCTFLARRNEVVSQRSARSANTNRACGEQANVPRHMSITYATHCNYSWSHYSFFNGLYHLSFGSRLVTYFLLHARPGALNNLPSRHRDDGENLINGSHNKSTSTFKYGKRNSNSATWTKGKLSWHTFLEQSSYSTSFISKNRKRILTMATANGSRLLITMCTFERALVRGELKRIHREH
jgi:hypothetical protein